jgi:2-keto-3-deoxy-L-rhamnonate aldolase RhmA
MEHTTNGELEVEQLIIAADASGITPIVRPPGILPNVVGRVLDAGALGIVFPDVRTVAQAELAARSTKYPPLGTRGWGGSHTRYAMWEGAPATAALRGTTVAERGVYSPEYVAKANADVMTILLVESMEGVENVEAIAAVEGVDGIEFGWADFAVQNEFDLELCEAAAARVFAACRDRGLATSVPAARADGVDQYGAVYFNVGIDTLLLSAAIRSAGERGRAARTPRGDA